MESPRTLVANRYRLDRALGDRPEPSVFLAEDERLGRAVVVKLARRPGPCLEAEILARLEHPNVARLLDVGQTGSGSTALPFLVLEHVAAPTLRTALKELRRLPPGRVVEIGLQVLSALEAAHRRGIVHGDLKPENLLWTRAGPAGGRITVIDFGAATLADEAPPDRPGTPPYVAPERLTGPRPLPSADLFGLGVVLWECAAGRRPFDRGPPTAPAPFLAEVVPTRPELAEVIDRAIALDPDDRFESAAEMRDALAAIAPEGPWELDLGRFVEAEDAISLPTLESVLDAEALESTPGPAEPDDAGLRIRSGELPTLWFLTGDPAMRRPEVIDLLEALDGPHRIHLLDEDARFMALWSPEDAEPRPWAVVFGGMHVALEDPLLGALRDDPDVAKVLLVGREDVEIAQAAIDWCGLDHLLSVEAGPDELHRGVIELLERWRRHHHHYDGLRLALRDAREDRARIERMRNEA